MVTVLVGHFEKGIMVEARPSTVISERCHRGIKEIKIAKPKANAPTFKYLRRTRIRIGDQPRVMDPFERKTVYIQTGVKDDGVFAKKNLIKGELFLYYSGISWNSTEQKLLSSNQTSDERYIKIKNAHFLIVCHKEGK